MDQFEQSEQIQIPRFHLGCAKSPAIARKDLRLLSRATSAVDNKDLTESYWPYEYVDIGRALLRT